MARKRHADEDTLKLLREIELKPSSGSDATYYNWRKRLGGMGRSKLSEIWRLEKQNAGLWLAIIWLAKKYCRYGHRKIAELLHVKGWTVNHKKIKWLWCEEGTQIQQRRKKRKRLSHKDSSIIRLGQTHSNHV